MRALTSRIFARMRYVGDVMYHVVKNKDLELDMSVVLSVVYMFDELETMHVIIVNDDDHTGEKVVTTDLMSFLVQFSGEVNVAHVQSTFQPWTLFRHKSRVERTNTCVLSATSRLNIHHLREDRPDKETSDVNEQQRCNEQGERESVG